MQNLRKAGSRTGASVQAPRTASPRSLSMAQSVASIGSLLKGPTLIAYSDDPVAAPKGRRSLRQGS